MKNTFLLTLIFAGVVLASCNKECASGICAEVDTSKEYIIKEGKTEPKKVYNREPTEYFLPKGFSVPEGYKVIDSSPNTISLELEGKRFTEAEFYAKYPDGRIQIDGADQYNASIYATLDEGAKKEKDIKAIIILTKK